MEGIVRLFARQTRALGLGLGVLAPLLLASPAEALVLSGVRNVTLNATTVTSLSIAITSGTSMNFTLLQGAIANGSTAAAITSSWNVNPGKTGTIALYGYFTTPSAALTGSLVNIASSY
ncbi:MAG TPA: hypothetical protein VFU59_04600, partial [Candidatus Eisenbacteria bacterium]|nr:hypothetical protein [Candidatus Eisenbacteria bacterium]